MRPQSVGSGGVDTALWSPWAENRRRAKNRRERGKPQDGTCWRNRRALRRDRVAVDQGASCKLIPSLSSHFLN